MKNHEEYGEATVPFPIPPNEYESILEQMEALELGDAVRQDCRISEMDSAYPILKRLETAGALKTYAIEHNGRLRKYYRITDEGRRRIDDFCASWSEMVRIHDYIEGARHDQA